MDSIKEKLKSMKSDIEEAKIEEVIKTRNEVEKKMTIGNNLFAHIPCSKSHLEIDSLSEALMPEDMVQGLQPFKSYGDGNCLFRSASILICGDESLHAVLRLLVASELFLNINFYVDHPKFPEVKQRLGFSMDTVYSSALCDSAYNALMTTKSVHTAVQVEAASVCILTEYATLIQLFALSSVLKRPIISVYPNANRHIREAFHTMVHPRECRFTTPVYIMWSRDAALDNVNNFNPNHFVPLMRTSNKKVSRKRINPATKPTTLKTEVVVLDGPGETPNDPNIMLDEEDMKLVSILEDLNGTEERPETVSQEEDGQRKKKLTGYNVFFSKMNPKVLEERPELKNKFGARSHIIGNLWKPRPDEEKQKYKDEAKAASGYQCDECGKQFKLKHDLERHMDTHLETVFECDQCAKKFKSRHSREIHKNCHTDKYKCLQCGKRFMQAKDLADHGKLHTTAARKPFQCNVCKIGFSQRKSLNAHNRKFHQRDDCLHSHVISS